MTKPIIDGLTAKNAMESRDWPTNAERALEILIKADDIEWESHGKEDVSALRKQVTELMKDPYHREPPF